MAKKKTYLVRESSYQEKPMVQFGEESERYALQFGPSKAKQFIAAVEKDGLKAVLQIIYKVAGEKTTAVPKAIK